MQNIWDTIIEKWKQDWWIDDSDIAMVIQPSFCKIFEYYDVLRYSSKCSSSDMITITENWSAITNNQRVDNSDKSWWLPWRLKIVIIVLVWWLLIMWWMIIFFSIKAKMSNKYDEDEW